MFQITFVAESVYGQSEIGYFTISYYCRHDCVAVADHNDSNVLVIYCVGTTTDPS